ncbi:MAG: phosphotransferase [Gammaproteobacteria bacterium]|nr:phosphotransferase [Gammaproteobacteria bacterium]
MTARHKALSHWLREVFQRNSFRLVPLSGDASFRRYWRLHVDDATYVVMDAPPEQEDCAPFLSVGAKIAAIGLPTPTVRHANLTEGFLVLDDLGDRLYLDELSVPGAPDRLYRAAIRALVTMQRNVDSSDLPEYDAQLLRTELALFPDWFLTQHLGYVLSNDQRRILDSAFDWLIEEILLQPRVFVHRDYHSRNLMVLPGDDPGIIDFQDGVLGPVSYDLVSLLRDVYVAWPAEAIQCWRDEYCRLAVAANVLTTDQAAAFPIWFDVMGVQRHLKVAGIFARLYHRDGKDRYLADLPLTIDYLLSIASTLPQLTDLSAMLAALDLPARLHQPTHPAPGPRK